MGAVKFFKIVFEPVLNDFWVKKTGYGRKKNIFFLKIKFYLIFLLLASSVQASPLVGDKQSGSKVNLEKNLIERQGFQRVTEAIAVVDKWVLTSREVQIVKMISDEIGEGSKSRSSMKLVDEESEEFRIAIGEALMELVLSLEAKNFSFESVSDQQVSKLKKKVVENFRKSSVWESLEVTDEEIEALIARKLFARNFLRFKTEAFTSQISDEDLKSFFEKNKDKMKDSSIDLAKANIQNFVEKQQVEFKLKEWIELLKRKYRMRFLGRAKAI